MAEPKAEGQTLVFFLDTEFNDELGDMRIELISLALVSEDGEREFYAESNEFSADKAHPWLHEHVLGKLGARERRLPVSSIRDGVAKYLSDAVRAAKGPPVNRVQIWAKNGALDFTILGLIFGGLSKYYDFMTSLGVVRNFFNDTDDLRARSPAKVRIERDPAQVHHALYDARNERMEYLALRKAIADQIKSGFG